MFDANQAKQLVCQANSQLYQTFLLIQEQAKSGFSTTSLYLYDEKTPSPQEVIDQLENLDFDLTRKVKQEWGMSCIVSWK